jgi:predicted  nucleic acid-binding Zn-ribbon protein
MELTHGKRKLLTAALLVLLTGSVAGNIYFWNKTSTLATAKAGLEQQAKDLLTRRNENIDRLTAQVETTRKNNTTLREEIQELNRLVSQLNTDLWELRTGKAGAAKTLARLQSKEAGQGLLWQNKASRLTDKHSPLDSQEDKLRQTISVLRDSLQMLSGSILTADSFSMIAFKKNNKETAKAKKVEWLTVSLDVPSVFSFSGREIVYLSLTDMQGNGVNNPIRTIVVPTPEEEAVIPVHDYKIVEFAGDKSVQQVSFNVHRAYDIKPGRYKASVYTKDRYLGSVELQFRDSFWFF